uniref:Uncharacterized protein n=1 Tax=Arundo donax TaxID=35708 RepID=A0A0A9EKI0_ARUDO
MIILLTCNQQEIKIKQSVAAHSSRCNPLQGDFREKGNANPDVSHCC